MNRIFLYAFIFFNISSVAIANVKPQDQFSSDIYNNYDDCVREKTKRAHYLLFEYDLENYRERLVNDEELSDFGRLLSCDIEDIMSPGGLSNTHSLFTRLEAEDIFTAILSYYAKIYDDEF